MKAPLFLYSMNHRTILVKNFNNGKGTETRLDNRRTVESSSINNLVGGQQNTKGIYRTAEAINGAGSTSPILTTEELEKLESRDINPY